MTEPRTRLLDALDELRNALLLAEPSRPSSLNEVAATGAALSKLAELGPSNLKDELHRVAQTVAALPQTTRPSVAARTLEQLEDQASELVHGVEQAADPAQEGPAAFERPAWVEPAVLGQYLSDLGTALDELETSFLALEQGDEEKPGLRRRLHSLKGEAGVLGLVDMEIVLHAMEDALEACANGCLVDRLLTAKDYLHKAVASYAAGRLPSPSGAEIAIALHAAAPPPTPPAEARWDADTLSMISEFLGEADDGLTRADQLLVDSDAAGLSQGAIDELFRVFHSMKGVAAFLDLDDVKAVAHETESMLGECRRGMLTPGMAVVDMVLEATECQRRLLRDVRIAAEQGRSLLPSAVVPVLVERIRAVIAGVDTSLPPAVSMPGERLGVVLSRLPEPVAPAVIEQAAMAQSETGRRLGAELLARGEVTARQVVTAVRAQAAPSADATDKASNGRLQELVKVDVNRIDTLVEMIGELVVVEAMVVGAPELTDLDSPRLLSHLSQLSKITRDLQDVGMRMRMVPLKGLFQKMERIVRDVSRKMGKKASLVISGEMTEIDRSLVEALADPLVHMIRNAVDHGLEGEAERLAAGKDATGTVRLAAYHEGGSIVVEISDDGKGMRRDGILRKALTMGIVDPAATERMSDAEVFALIFAPGFSTAKEVTEVSGRGVGMDVVRRNIEAVRGRVTIASEPGRGSTFRICLPLTLAIIDGMIIESAGETYIIPTLSIVESLQIQPGMLVTFAGRSEMVNVRGEILPLVRLDALLEAETHRTEASLVVVVEGMGVKIGLAVDDVVTQQQVVIKSLGTELGQTELFSGAAILSDGRVGLILNVESLVAVGKKTEAKPQQAA